MHVYFSGEPLLEPHADGVHWTIKKQFLISVGHINIAIRPGFVTDLGSIPKAFQNIVSPEGPPLRAFLGHDWLYAKQFFSRYDSDVALLRMMKYLRVGWLERWAVFIAVRLGGGFAWRADTRRKQK